MKTNETKSARSISQRIKQFFRFDTLESRIIVTFIVMGISIFITAYWAMATSLDREEKVLVTSELKTDMAYLKTIIGEDEWRIEDGTLYCGDVMLGDGTLGKANIGPFNTLQYHTSDMIYSYSAIKDPKSGRYIRTAGNTTDEAGSSIVGTVLETNISQAIDRDGYYLGNITIGDSEYTCYYEAIYDKNSQIIGFLVTARNVSDVYAQNKFARNIAGASLILIILMAEFGLIYRMRNLVGSIYEIREYLDEMGTGVFPADPLVVDAECEIIDIVDSVNNMKLSLQEQKRLEGELTVARDIQSSLLPSNFPMYQEHGEFDVYAAMQPAREVGGDLYDIHMLDDKHLAIYIADVSGKGVPAALIMTITKIISKVYASVYMNPAQTLETVNNVLAEDNKDSYFVTAWLGILNLETGEMKYSNAGHNPPALLQNGEYHLIKQHHGFVLGGFPDIKYREGVIQMNPGDKIFLYTDGVTEAQNSQGEMFGEARLLDGLNQLHDETPEQTVRKLGTVVKQFVGTAEPFDDLTVLALEYAGINFKTEDKETNVKSRKFNAELSELDNLTAYLEEEMEASGVSMKSAMKISMAAEEIFVNIANYAYEGDGTVVIDTFADDEKFYVRFKDTGIPFDPLAQSGPDTTLSAEERAIGGLGIHLVRNTMDQVHYKYEDGMNILEIAKVME